MSKPNESLRDAVFLAFPVKPGELAAEIARLMREGTAESRKKAQELFQTAMAETGGAVDEDGVNRHGSRT